MIGLLSPTGVQAAVNYFDQTYIATGYGTAYCPAGYRVSGGGVRSLPSDSFWSTSSTEYKLTGSYPASATSWRATATRTTGSYSSYSGWRFTRWTYTPTAYAVCVR